MHVERAQPPGFDAGVQRPHVFGGAPPGQLQPAMQVLDLRRPLAAGALQSGRELLGDIALLDLLLVEVEHQPVQANLRQPLGDRLDGGPLLCDEQHTPADGGCGRDDVGDRLALAGAGWTDDHRVAACADRVDGVLLGRVCIENKELLAGRHGVADRRRRRPVGVEPLLGRQVTRDRSDGIAAGQQRRGGPKILNHRELLVAEQAECDRPPQLQRHPTVLGGLRNGPIDAIHRVIPVGSRCRLLPQFELEGIHIDVQPEEPLQHVRQDRVGLGVVAHLEREVQFAGPRRRDRDPGQQQRRPERRTGRTWPRPSDSTVPTASRPASKPCSSSSWDARLRRRRRTCLADRARRSSSGNSVERRVRLPPYRSARALGSAPVRSTPAPRPGVKRESSVLVRAFRSMRFLAQAIRFSLRSFPAGAFVQFSYCSFRQSAGGRRW